MKRTIYTLSQAATELGVTPYFAEKRLGKPLPRNNEFETHYYPSSAIESLRYQMNPPQFNRQILSDRNIARLTENI